jgi:hypothetical protein
MTSKDLSIFNSLRPFSIGFDDMFDQFENMLGKWTSNDAIKLPTIQYQKDW